MFIMQNNEISPIPLTVQKIQLLNLKLEMLKLLEENYRQQPTRHRCREGLSEQGSICPGNKVIDLQVRPHKTKKLYTAKETIE